MHIRLLVSIALVLGSSACVHREDVKQPFGCVAGQTCTVEGRLNLFAGEPVWIALVESGHSCVKLALPDKFYSDAKQWDGKKVQVIGQAFQQMSFDESNGVATLWYTEQDRKIALGMCDHGLGIYVESMRSKAGKEWPGPNKRDGGN